MDQLGDNDRDDSDYDSDEILLVSLTGMMVQMAVVVVRGGVVWRAGVSAHLAGPVTTASRRPAAPGQLYLYDCTKEFLRILY